MRLHSSLYLHAGMGRREWGAPQSLLLVLASPPSSLVERERGDGESRIAGGGVSVHTRRLSGNHAFDGGGGRVCARTECARALL